MLDEPTGNGLKAAVQRGVLSTGTTVLRGCGRRPQSHAEPDAVAECLGEALANQA
jgi:hypothetical protein